MKFRARLKFLAALAAAACSSEPTDGGDLLVVSQIDVQPPGATIILGATQQFSATPKTSSGITVPNRPVIWSSSDLGIATVSSGGLVTGIAVGPATISAHVDDVTADVTVNITPKPVASVSVEPPQATLTIGGMQQLLATPRDAQGQALQDRPVTFQSDNPAVASVSVTGVVTAVAVGVTTIRATSEGRTGTSAITVTPRPATRLAFTTQPANGIAGQALPAIRVAVQDEQGGTISDAVTTITLAIADNAGGSTLSGTTTANAVAGVATFSNVRLDKAGDGYTLRASATPLSPAVSAPFNIVAGTATRLLMATQPPATAQSGVPLSVDPVVRIVDASGNAVAQAGVEISVQIVGTGATLAGDLSVPTLANGTATFSGLTLTGSGGSYTLRFLASGLTEVVSTPITVTSSVATGLMILTQPSTSAQSNVPFAQQPVIQLRDNNNNPVAITGVAVTASIATGGGTLVGTATITTDAAGRAAFTNLRISGSAGARTIQFSSPGLALVISSPITITAAPATKLGLITQPSAAAAGGAAFAQQPVVQIQDADGNAVALPGVAVTATIESGPGGGALGGTTAIVTSATGKAEFTNLSLTGPAGAYTLRFAATGFTSVISTSVTLGAGAPTKLTIAIQPSASVQNGVPFPQQPAIQLQDAVGNPSAQAGVLVTVTIQSGNPALSGTLTATTNGAGLATFTNLELTGVVGDRTLSFAATGLTSVTSSTITVTPGPASALTITTQPSGAAQSGVALGTQPAIQVRDESGNLVNVAGIVITATIGAGSPAGSLTNATASTNASGLATFSGLTISGPAGSYTLQFSTGALPAVTSNSITLSSGAASKLAITAQPSITARNDLAFPAQPVIQVTDAGGNPVSTAGVIVTASIATGGGALGGTPTATTNGAGVATFTDLKITGTVGVRTLTFSATSLTSITSNGVTITAGIAIQIVMFTQPPATVATGAVLAPGPVVDLQDVSGNDVDSAGVAIDVAISSGGGTLGGTTPVATAANGRAAFGDLTITGSPGNRQLQFTHAGLGSATSNNVAVTAGPPATIAVTQQPSAAATNDVPFAQQPIVHVEDGGGNPVSGATVTVSLSGGGTLSGGALSVATDGSGNASFSGLKIVGLAGTKNLQFVVGALAPVASAAIALSAGSATALVITSSPPAGATENATFGATVELRDSGGNLVAANGVNIAVSLVVESGSGTLSGTTPIATVAGVSTFSDLSINLAGTYHLHFTSGGLPSIDSGQIVVTP